MKSIPTTLVLSAADEQQAEQFRYQLERREQLGLLYEVRDWMVVPDPPGRRVGSGGSTVHLIQALVGEEPPEESLRGRRVLILHGGGESRRMPAYALCGKLFCPVPARVESPLPPTLFDMQLERYLQLPHNPRGQVVICAGDVLLRFDPTEVNFDHPGLCGVAARESPREASGHGVYHIAGQEGAVEHYLQKPTVEQMERAACLDATGRAAIDLGIMSLTPEFAGKLVSINDQLCENGEDIVPLDFYTEIACALGAADFDEYQKTVRKHGASQHTETELRTLWQTLREQPFHCSVVPRCTFLHFGTSEDC